jgi:anti-sigma B factor antagonist
MDLGFSTAPHGSWAVLSVRGEVDVATAPQLRERMVDLVSQGSAKIILDLGDVGFLDSTGLGVIVGCLKRARANDGDIVLVCDQRPILKVLEITGLTTVFGVHATVDEALAATGAS